MWNKCHVVFLEESLNWVETTPSTSSWLDMKRATDSALQTEDRCALKCLHFHRKEDEDGQLTAAQIYLKLGEVSAESGKFKYGVGGRPDSTCDTAFIWAPPHCLIADR